MPKPSDQPSGPSKPTEAEDPGVLKLRQAAMDTYARQARQSKTDLVDQARADRLTADMKAELNDAAGIREPSAVVILPAPAAPVPVASATRQVMVPPASGQKLPARGPKGKA